MAVKGGEEAVKAFKIRQNPDSKWLKSAKFPIQNDYNPVILKNVEKALKESGDFFAHF